MVRFAGGGRTYNPYAFDTPAEKRRRLDATADLATSIGLPEVGGFLEEAADLIDSTGDQVVPTALSLKDSGKRSGGMGASRRRRGRRGRKGRKGRRSLRSKIFRGILRYKEKHHIKFGGIAQTLNFGDAISPVIRLYNPSQLVPSGTTEASYVGNTFYLRGYRLRAFITAGAAISQNFTVCVRFFSSAAKCDCTTGGTLTNNEGITYGNTTTTITNPTQSGNGEENIPMFDETTRPFTGLNPSSVVNTDYVSTIRAWYFNFVNYGVATTDVFKTIDIWMPVNRIVELESIESAVSSPAAFLKGRNYYYSVQIYGQDPIAATTAATYTPTVTVYFRDF